MTIREFVKCDGVKYSVRSSRERAFFPNEWTKFIEALGTDKAKFAFDCLINTGARFNELYNVLVQDVKFDNFIIELRVCKKKAVKKEQADGSFKMVASELAPKSRLIPVSSQFMKRVRKWVKDQELKPTDRLVLIGNSAANQAMKAALKLAEFSDWQEFSVHNCRKTLENWLLSLGVDSLKLSKHFGHTIKVAEGHYVNTDIYRSEHRAQMRDIIGDLYAN